MSCWLQLRISTVIWRCLFAINLYDVKMLIHIIWAVELSSTFVEYTPRGRNYEMFPSNHWNPPGLQNYSAYILYKSSDGIKRQKHIKYTVCYISLYCQRHLTVTCKTLAPKTLLFKRFDSYSPYRKSVVAAHMIHLIIRKLRFWIENFAFEPPYFCSPGLNGEINKNNLFWKYVTRKHCLLNRRGVNEFFSKHLIFIYSFAMKPKFTSVNNLLDLKYTVLLCAGAFPFRYTSFCFILHLDSTETIGWKKCHSFSINNSNGPTKLFSRPVVINLLWSVLDKPSI